MFKPLLFSAFLAVVLPAAALPDDQFQPAFSTFSRAAGGDASAIDPAAEAFAALRKAEPANPVLLAYSGAATSMRATTTWLPWKKMQHAEDGLAQLDKALAMLQPAHDAGLQRGTPAVLEVKLVAANTFLAVPGFMNRKDKGLRLLGEVVASPLLPGAPAEFRQAVGQAAQRAGLGEGRAQ
jgi:hypothetical protein